ncbi:MAG TPA: VWA domain-containing protein [Thermoanaerobaculia bacterium]|nr:VWA domain-containing protein [Thermoanaerobaculia bacterium]
MSHRRAAILLVIPLAILLGAAAPQPSGQFGETTNVLEVQIPVQVVLDGEPVRGLREENFEVYEGRWRQRLVGFNVVDLREIKSATPSAGALPPAARRRFLLLFDLTFSEPSSILRARLAALKLVHEEMNPSDLVGVATYSLSRGPRLILNFTTDRNQVDAAIQTLDLPQLATEAPDPLRLMIESVRQGQIRAPGLSGRHQAAQEVFYQHLLDLQHQKKGADLQTESNEAIAFSQALADMGKSLAAVPGRKYVLFLSEGFNGDVLSGGKISSETHQNIERGQNWKVDTSQIYGSTRVRDEVDKMLDSFRRSDCVIEAIDIGGLRAATAERQRPNGDASLFLMANDTGGELYQHYNDLGQAMHQLLDRTGVVYLLAFKPGHVKADGSYHRIRVKLVNAPDGARAVARPGYYAPSLYGEMSPSERRLENAALVLASGEGGQIPISALAAPFPLRGSAEKAYVPVLVEINGKALLDGATEPEAGVEIYAYALDNTGRIHDYRVQALRIDVKQMGKTIEKTGLKFFGHLDLAPGAYSLRILVRNPQSGTATVRLVHLEVPDFDQAQPLLLRPFFPEQPGKWVVVREAANDRSGKNVPYPFMAGRQPFIPESAPELSASTVPLYLIGYHLPTSALDLEAILTRPDGTRVAGGELRVSDAPEASSREGKAIRATFSTQGLAPGHYQLRVELKTASGRTESPPAPFTIGGS